jgi:hypothetical protein
MTTAVTTAKATKIISIKNIIFTNALCSQLIE